MRFSQDGWSMNSAVRPAKKNTKCAKLVRQTHAYYSYQLKLGPPRTANTMMSTSSVKA